jgi:glutathione reductase (NADPH)
MSMASNGYDVLILGGGNAGFGVTVPTREAGLKVAMVEERDLGGTCPNRGCTPKKVLVAAGHALHEINQAHVHGISVSSPKLDWAALIDREKQMIGGVPDSLAETLEERGVALFRDSARFVGAHAVKVGNVIIEAEHIVIATGSRPRPLPIPGAELLITSDEVLSEREQPGSVLFIGGGVIALEFAHVYARAGTSVTILEALPRILPALDADAVAELRSESERIGIEVQTGVKVVRVETSGNQLRTVFAANGKEQSVVSDRVVNGAGRIPNVEHLDLDAGGVAHDGLRLSVDAHLRSTSNPGVYACGDVLSGPPQLSPLAGYEGKIVGRNIVEGPKHTPDYASVPSAVYTVPALASVGLTEAQVKEKGLKAKITVSDMDDWFSTRTYAETKGWAKVIVDEASDAILGAHMLGHRSEELINIFGLARAHGITATGLRDFIYAYPSFSADIKHML